MILFFPNVGTVIDHNITAISILKENQEPAKDSPICALQNFGVLTS